MPEAFFPAKLDNRSKEYIEFKKEIFDLRAKMDFWFSKTNSRISILEARSAPRSKKELPKKITKA